MASIFRNAILDMTVEASITDKQADFLLCTPDDYTIRFVITPPAYKAFKNAYKNCESAVINDTRMPCIEFFETTLKEVL